LKKKDTIGLKPKPFKMEKEILQHVFSQAGSGFKNLRTKVLQSLGSIPVPDRKTEDYKYTPIAQSLLKNFSSLKSEPYDYSDSLKTIDFPIFDTYTLVLINGVFSEELSSIPASIEIKADFDENDIDKRFGTIAIPEKDYFVALNTIQFHQAISIHIPDSFRLEKPVSIINLTDSSQGKVLCSPRVLITLGRNSNANFYEFCYSTGKSSAFNNTVVEIFAENDSLGNYTLLQLNNDYSVAHHSSFIQQKANSLFNLVTITLGGAMIRNNPHFLLDDEHVESHLYGLYLLNKNQHADNHTVVDHRKANSYSNELYKGILKEKSTGVFNGKIFVRPDAQKTNAYQSNKNILLSDDATINTKPQLEIWADDVKCSHGCTTGQLDDEQIFYLRSRGIDKNTAISMVLHAFQNDILEKIPNPEVVNYLNDMINEKLGDIF